MDGLTIRAVNGAIHGRRAAGPHFGPHPAVCPRPMAKEHDDVRARIRSASPITRRVLRLTAAWLLVSVAGIVASILLGQSVSRGIVVRLPAAAWPVVWTLSALSSLAALYTVLHTAGRPGVAGWLRAGAAAVLYPVLTIQMLGYALPALSTLVVARPAYATLTVTGVSRARTGRIGCGSRVATGGVFTPGGAICVGQGALGYHVGDILEVEGLSNGWAMRVERIGGRRRPDQSRPD